MGKKFGLIGCFILGLFSVLNAQIKSDKFHFSAHPNQIYGFDSYKYKAWEKNYQQKDDKKHITYKSIVKAKDDSVLFVFPKYFNYKKLSFLSSSNQRTVKFIVYNDTAVCIPLNLKKDEVIVAKYEGVVLAQLNVKTFSLIKEKVVIVPINTYKLNKAFIKGEIRKIYQQAGLDLNIDIQQRFKSEIIGKKELFTNPNISNTRFTKQMKLLRDEYFDVYPKADKEAYYVFLIDGYMDTARTGFMVYNKSIAYVKYTNSDQLPIWIAKELGHGIGILKDSWVENGPKQGSTTNLMDIGNGTHLTYEQWKLLRHSSHSFSIFDSYENVRANNGIVAYYFWEENRQGDILFNPDKPLRSIVRPFKKNSMSYHFNIDNITLKSIFKIYGYDICFWDLVAFVLILLFIRYLRIKWFKLLKAWFKRPWFFKLISRIVLFVAAISLMYLSYQLIGTQYDYYQVKQGKIDDLKGLSIRECVREITENENRKVLSEGSLSSEIMKKSNNRWYMYKRKNILYFNVFLDEKDQIKKIRFVKDSDSLIASKVGVRMKPSSHYFVFNYLKENKLEEQEIYDHLGFIINEKIFMQDIPKRILLMVNGYRPTSIGHTLEDNFKDIENHGIEFANSNNQIYGFDRFDYWRPWNKIDLLFQNRVNPSEVMYADGHFSVSTSNHRSLFNFTKTSAVYPHRCANPRRHECKEVSVPESNLVSKKIVRTIHLLNRKPNKSGFDYRYENGKIAGRNILQLLNEMPNVSKNDTLFIVAHSMGYAYSLGIIEVLKGKINFGDLYIIAPENASAGKVNLSEWKNVWQYGSKYNEKEQDAPCLQDGVAPQTRAGGLTEWHRLYIPEHFYIHKGFFDSHFIGYYTWIFDIPQGQRGFIPQR